jgi:hypothetical protein
MDGNEYEEKYLVEKDDTFVFATVTDIDRMSVDDMNHCPKCIIRNGMKSFQEVKDYIKTKRGNNDSEIKT